MEEGARKEKKEGSITKKKKKKEKRGKTLGEKSIGMHQVLTGFASDVLLEGKILYCLGYMVNHTD